MTIYVGSSTVSNIYYGSTQSKIYYGSIQVSGGGTTFGLVANRTQIATNVEAFSVVKTHRREHYAHSDGDITGIVFVDVGWRFASTNTTAATSHTRTKWLEYPEGVFTQVTHDGGQTTGWAISGAIIQKWDAMAITIPAGAKFWERTVHTAGNIGLLELPTFPSVLGVDDGVADGSLGNSGTIPASTNRHVGGSQWIEGTILTSGAKSFVIMGNSIAWGEGDISSVGALRGSGYQARALDTAGYPWMKIAIAGQQATDVVALLANVDNRMDLLLAGVAGSDVWMEHGVNDLRLGRTQTQYFNDMTTIVAALPVGKRISQSTITPRTTSTDSYATTVNQTVRTDGNWGALSSVNAAIRAVPAYVNGYIHEVADLAMTARDSGVWPAPPVPTTDGTHPNSTMAATIAAGLTL